jgi:hypothetical protein
MKHVEQAIRSAKKNHLLPLVGILFPHMNETVHLASFGMSYANLRSAS